MANLTNHLVTVKDAANNVVASGYTNNNGDVSFSVPEGTYKIEVEAPAGYQYMSGSISDANGTNNNVAAIPIQGVDVVKGNPANVTANFIEV